jgi:hypothetical protein
LFVALMLVTLGTTVNAEQIPAHSAWHGPILAIQFVGSASLIAFFYLFPDGRFVPRWTRWLALVLVALLVPFFVVPTLAVTRGQSPLGFLVAVAVLATAAGAQLYRYRRVSGPAQRQQAKWLVLGLAVMVGGLVGEGGLALLFPTRVHPGSPAWLFLMWLQYVLFVFVPLSIGVALLRYRLWDVDLLINKVLVYGALTATLGVLYIGSVVGLSELLRGLTGERSTVAIVISTLMAAGLVQPLKRRIQTAIDRRFYRRKYDAAQALAAFSARLRDEVELNAVTADLLAVVDETMQPAHVALWLREPERKP